VGGEVGELPAGWRLVRLEEIVTEGPTNGYSPPAAPGARGSRSLKLSATTQGRMILSPETIKPLHETIPPGSWQWLAPGDLLVQRSNTADLVGTAAVYDGPPNAFVYPDLMMRIRFSDPATTRWVWRYMNSPIGRRFFSTMAAGAAGSMPKISGAKLRAMPIVLPPLPEQRRIADILDKADAIRRKRKEAIALTDELLRSAFLEMFGDPVSNPKGWEVRALGAYCDMETGFAFQSARFESDGVRLCRGANVLPGAIDWSDVRYWPSREDVADRYRLRAGDVVLAMDRPWISSGLKVAIVSAGDLPAHLVQRVARLRAICGLTNEYIYFALLQPQFARHCAARMTETTVPHISPHDIRSHVLPVPDHATLRRFSQVGAMILDAKRQAERALADAEVLFASLVSRVFRGDPARCFIESTHGVRS